MSVIENNCFGTRLKNTIKNSGYTQSDFSEKIGVAKTTLVKYMSGKIDPPLSVFVKICDILNTPYDYMLDEKIPLDENDREVYDLLKNLGYNIRTNPEDENEIKIDYHGKTIVLNYKDIKEKISIFICFLLYQKTI